MAERYQKLSQRDHILLRPDTEKYTVYLRTHKKSGKMYVGCTKQDIYIRHSNDVMISRTDTSNTAIMKFLREIESSGLNALYEFDLKEIAIFNNKKEAEMFEEKLTICMSPELNMKQGNARPLGNPTCRSYGEYPVNVDPVFADGVCLGYRGTYKNIRKRFTNNTIFSVEQLCTFATNYAASGSVDGYTSDIGPKYITMVNKTDSIAAKIKKDNKWYTKYFKGITLENYEKAIKWRDDKLNDLEIPVPVLQMSFDPVNKRYILSPDDINMK
jgi:hypothetical protein